MRPDLRLMSRLMQAGMVGVALAGIVTDNLAWVPAAVVSLLVSLIPSLLRRDLNLVLPLELNFWIVLALFLHVVGGFSGFYDNVPGWDHLTHAMSASLIGALGFVVIVSVDKYVESIHLPRQFLGFFIVMFTMAMGVLWEIMEFANDSIAGTHLQYGLTDTMLDLLFDGFAAFVVGIAGAHYLVHVTPEHFVERLNAEKTREKIAGFWNRRKRKR
jgi:hypothetical protein